MEESENMTIEEKDVAIFWHQIEIAKICREQCVDAMTMKEPKRSETLTYAFYQAGRAGVSLESMRADVDEFNDRIANGII